METVTTTCFLKGNLNKINEKEIYAMHLNFILHEEFYQYPKGIPCVSFMNKHLSIGKTLSKSLALEFP
mgnify:FL=1